MHSLTFRAHRDCRRTLSLLHSAVIGFKPHEQRLVALPYFKAQHNRNSINAGKMRFVALLRLYVGNIGKAN
jgi:hypothetical protein